MAAAVTIGSLKICSQLDNGNIAGLHVQRCCFQKSLPLIMWLLLQENSCHNDGKGTEYRLGLLHAVTPIYIAIFHLVETILSGHVPAIDSPCHWLNSHGLQNPWQICTFSHFNLVFWYHFPALAFF